MRQKWTFPGSNALLLLFFLLLLFEGAIRKWAVQGADFLVQGIRDGLPIVTLVVYAIERRMHAGKTGGTEAMQALPFSFFGYFIVAMISAVISAQQSILVSLLGIRTHFAYVPLAILIPALLIDRIRIRQALAAVLALGLPICLLALYQTTEPQFSQVNIYASGEEAGATFGEAGLVRATGTFSYITGMAFFAQFVAVCSVYFFITTTSFKVRLFAFVMLQLGIVASVSTGSRGALLGIFLQAGLVALLCPAVITQLHARIVVRYLLASIATFWVAFYFATEQVEAFLERVESSSGDELNRLWEALFEWIEVISKYPLGEGIGSGHLGAATLLGREREFAGYEAELSRIAYELGAAGFALFLLFRINVILVGLRVLSLSRMFEQRLLSAVALSVLLVHSIGGMYTPIANALYWSALGVIYLEARQNWAAAIAGSPRAAPRHRVTVS